jgi:hypothetical protein
MYPHERSLVKELKDQPFALVGINRDREVQKLREVIAREKITWRNLWDDPDLEDRGISRWWQVRGWPTIILIDATGRIRYRSIGIDAGDLDRLVDELLAEATGKKTERPHDRDGR